MLGLLTLSWLVVGNGFGQPASRVVPGIQPIAYFQENCARCHGNYGSNYGDQFARNLDDAKLSKAVDDMCAGPGNAPLSGVDLQAEIAFHRALSKGEPFLCVTKIDGRTISGEVSLGAKVTLEPIAFDDHKILSASVDGTTWMLTVEPQQTHPMTIVATLNGKRTEIPSDARTGQLLFSHTQPSRQPTTQP